MYGIRLLGFFGLSLWIGFVFAVTSLLWVRGLPWFRFLVICFELPLYC